MNIQRLTLTKMKHYPFFAGECSTGKHNVLLGIGGNMGDVPRRFEYLYYFLLKSPFVTVVETSPILRNPPFGYLEQDDFYNAVIHIQTMLMPRALLDYLLRVEKRFGRKRNFENGPRTLDIDMIFYDNREIDTDRLTLPHPHWRKRDSVLIPLAQMKGVSWLKRLL